MNHVFWFIWIKISDRPNLPTKGVLQLSKVLRFTPKEAT